MLSFGRLGSPTISNVCIRGEPGAEIRMHRPDYDNTSIYNHSEHRHGLSFYNTIGASASGLSISDTGGDGLYVCNASNFSARGINIRRAYRNGVSLIAADNLLLEDVRIFDVDGTNPRSGIDIEPNKPYEHLANITLRRCTVDGAAGCGIEIKHAFAMKANPVPVSILIDSCKVANIGR